MDKPEVLALKQTITWGRELEHRKVFRKEELLCIFKQLNQDQRDADFQDMIRQFNSLLDSLDIEKELNNYSEEEAKGWFLALNKIREKLNKETEKQGGKKALYRVAQKGGLLTVHCKDGTADFIVDNWIG